MNTPFPAGLAMGDAFYDRVQERKNLQQNILHGMHTVLIAPRRFGKTSLIKKVLEENSLPHLWLDFMVITSIEDAESRFLSHIAELIVTLAGNESRLKNILHQYFNRFKPEISLGIPGFLKVTFQAETVAHGALTEVLLTLDTLAQNSHKQMVIVCDEFQEIVNIDKNATLQASIRHAAERSQAITYLFSGSRHQPLRRLFTGKQNPLYELCDHMTIERVPETEYRQYLQCEAKKKWGYELSEAILQKIFQYTDYYPKYINALCAKLWFHEAEPSETLVDELWQHYIFSRKSSIAEELKSLSLNQRKLLRYLASHPSPSPFSYETSMGAGLSVSAIQTALPVLLERDLVVQMTDGYRVLDPTFKFYFEMF